MPDNLYRVPKAQWKKWTPHAKRVFNHLHGMMLDNEDLFHHPAQALIHPKFWKTTAWNAAWEAAHAVDNV